MPYPITSIISESLRTFYGTALENNGKAEALANYFLQPVRCSIPSQFGKGKIVKIYEGNKYLSTSENLNIMSHGFRGYTPLHDGALIIMGVAIGIILGTALKLVAWMINPSSCIANYKFTLTRLKELQKTKPELVAFSKDLITNVQNEWEKTLQNPNQNSIQDSDLINLPSDMIKEIANHLDSKDLVKFMLTCRRAFLVNQNYLGSLTKEEKWKMIEKEFPKELCEELKPLFDAKPFPLIKMQAHRVTTIKIDHRIQGAFNETIQGGINPIARYDIQNPIYDYWYPGGYATPPRIPHKITALNPKDMDGATIAIGFDPIPLIAVRVIHRVPDDRIILSGCRFLFYILFKMDWVKATYLENEEVILFHTLGTSRGDQFWGVSDTFTPSAFSSAFQQLPQGYNPALQDQIRYITSSIPSDQQHSKQTWNWFATLLKGERVADLYNQLGFIPTPAGYAPIPTLELCASSK